MSHSLSLFARLKLAAAELRSTKSLVGASMMAALNLVLNQFTIMVSQMLEIGFAFLATAAAAYLYGPWLAGLMGIVTDTVGYFLRPNGPYFPFWALNEFLLGFLYGCFFYKRPVTLARTAAAYGTAMVIINLGLSPLWLHMMYGNALVITGARLIKNLVMFPLNTALLYAVLRALQARRRAL